MKPLYAPVLLSLAASSFSFSQITETKIAGTDKGFGHSVAIEADHLLIGEFDYENRGAGHFYRKDGNGWIFTQTVVGELSSYDRFGFDVALSGNTALIGDSDPNQGAFYTYFYNGSIWVRTSITGWSEPFQGFGNSVCLDSNTALVSATREDFNGDNSGAVIAFTAAGSGWNSADTLIADDGVEDDEFGSSVSFDGDLAIVGVNLSDAAGNNSGAVYFFQRTGTSWIQTAKLTGGDSGPDQFGKSVSLSGEYALVGAPFADTEQSNSGAAYVFKHEGSSWVEQAKLVAQDRSLDDQFGASVALLGDYAVIGAVNGDGLVTGSGSAYVFKREGSSWNQVVELNASDGFEQQRFGISVDISNDFVVVGAPGVRSADDGSVYLYSGYAEALASVAVTIDSIYQTVPPQGATFPYNVTFTNNTADTLAIDFWTKLVRPDGSSVDPLLGPKTPVLGPHAVIDKSPIMSVPANRDPGDYLLIAYLGTYPDDVVDTDTTGFTKLASGLREEQAAEATKLEGNHPNPFNPSTTFSYTLSEPGQVSLRVYNTLGQLVKTIVDQEQVQGHHEAVWDGRNEIGSVVAGGIYLYRIVTADYSETRKMLMMK